MYTSIILSSIRRVLNDIRYIYFMILVSMMFLQISCRTPIPGIYKPFFNLSEETQCEEFKKYSLSQQLDIAILEFSNTHPWSRRMHTWIASKGETNIPRLLEMLNRLT